MDGGENNKLNEVCFKPYNEFKFKMFEFGEIAQMERERDNFFEKLLAKQAERGKEPYIFLK